MSAISPPHPKINYISMAVDDTMYDYSGSNVDAIAAKYLPPEYIQKQGKVAEETRNKTVKFEGVYAWETPNRYGITKNTASVNFSCNMSIATKKYLQKYELLSSQEHDNDDRDSMPLKEHNGRVTVVPLKQPITQQKLSPFSETDRFEKENILDLKKLRKLPKLKY